MLIKREAANGSLFVLKLGLLLKTSHLSFPLKNVTHLLLVNYFSSRPSFTLLLMSDILNLIITVSSIKKAPIQVGFFFECYSHR